MRWGTICRATRQVLIHEIETKHKTTLLSLRDCKDEILSNNQSRATRWVRDTCLIVGLLPLMIIFITASLSSNMYNCDSFSERCAFERTQIKIHILIQHLFNLGCVFLSLHQFPVCTLGFVLEFYKSTASKPSIRKSASNDMISYFVDLWDADVCFLHIQLIGTNVRLLAMHRIPPDDDFESSRSPAKSESWNNLIDNVEPHCPHENIGGSHLWNECRRLIVPIVCHMLESVLWQIVPVCWLTDHRMSGRPLRAMY